MVAYKRRINYIIIGLVINHQELSFSSYFDYQNLNCSAKIFLQLFERPYQNNFIKGMF